MRSNLRGSDALRARVGGAAWRECRRGPARGRLEMSAVAVVVMSIAGVSALATEEGEAGSASMESEVAIVTKTPPAAPTTQRLTAERRGTATPRFVNDADVIAPMASLPVEGALLARLACGTNGRTTCQSQARHRSEWSSPCSRRSYPSAGTGPSACLRIFESSSTPHWPPGKNRSGWPTNHPGPGQPRNHGNRLLPAAAGAPLALQAHAAGYAQVFGTCSVSLTGRAE